MGLVRIAVSYQCRDVVSRPRTTNYGLLAYVFLFRALFYGGVMMRTDFYIRHEHHRERTTAVDSQHLST